VAACPLFPYQRDDYELVRREYARGARKILFVGPTGYGKGRFLTEFIINALRKGLDGPAVWVTHTTDLAEQARKALIQYGVPPEAIGLIVGGKRLHYDRPVQVAIAAKLLAVVARGGLLPKSRLVLLDEGHHFVADKWGAIARELMADGGFTLLLTATPERPDGRPMGDMAEAMVVGASVRRLQALKRLVPCLTIDPRGPSSRHLAAEPVDAYLKHAPGRMGILYGSSIEFVEGEARKFTEAGVPAAVVHHRTPDEKRSAIRESFSIQSEAPLRGAGFTDPVPRVLCDVGTMVEGSDVPPVSCIMLTQLHTHAGQYIQRGGRGLRWSDDAELYERTGLEPKCDLVLIDLTGNREQHGNLDDDREYSLEGKAIRRVGAGSDPTEMVCSKCGCVVERWNVVEKRKACPHCGALGREMTTIEVRERELEEAGRIASVPSKAKTFLFYLDEAKRNGHQRGFAIHRYKPRYGSLPWDDRDVWPHVKQAWETF
jgi:DNA repair protein RadD